MPIDPIAGLGGAEWQIPPVTESAPAPKGNFGSMLAGQLQQLEKTQVVAAEGAQALATGTATDPTSVVMAVERAQLSMQLASQIRNKAVEAAQTIFQTQI